MKPAQLDQLRDELPEFGEPPGTPEYREFLDYYGLDFDTRYPRVAYRAGLSPSGDFQLMTHSWTLPDARANLLLVHGYFDHTGIYDKLIDYGLSRSCNVLIFDLPGHGLSSGGKAVIDDFSDYGDAVASVLAAVKLPDLPLYVLAQSTGCAALMEFARRHAWPAGRRALLVPRVLQAAPDRLPELRVRAGLPASGSQLDHEGFHDCCGVAYHADRCRVVRAEEVHE